VIPSSRPSTPRALAAAVEDVRVVMFEGCGHYPHHEKPRRFLRELSEFLDDPALPRSRLRPSARRAIAAPSLKLMHPLPATTG
jgi:alpha-beta hydrolase superfamily lysophospholipase